MVIEIEITKGCEAYDTCPEDDPTGAGPNVAGEQPDSTTKVKADFEPNVLDDYDSYTYHFRLFMMAEDAIRSGTFGPESKNQRVVIAESGVTTIEIDEVTISSIAGISKEAGIGAATNFSFQLRQAYGATLLDQIFEASNFLGIKNFRTVPMFLELSFRARDPDRTLGGTIPGGAGNSLLGDNDKLRDVVWVWPIQLTNMAIAVDTGGSVYTLDAAIYGDLAYTNQAADVEKTTTVQASTVKEFFEGLETELNKKEEQKDKNKETIFDTYEFYIDKEIAKSKIVPEVAEDVANRAAEFSVEIAEKNEFTFNPGVSIDRIIENILSTTEFFQKKAKGTSDANATDEEGQGEKAAIQTLYRLITDTKLGKYDPKKGDYARIYRYMIVPYEMTTIQTKSNSDANLSNQARYDLVQRKGRLRKSYNYIYTGLNDQVLDFEFAFNFNWYAALPFQAGTTTTNAAAEPTAAPPKNDEQGERQQRAQEGGNGVGDETDTDKYGLGDFTDDVTQFLQSPVGGAVVDGIFTGNFDQLTGLTSEFVASEVSRGIRVAGANAPGGLAQFGFRELDPTIEDVVGDETTGNPFKNIFFVEDRPGSDQNISGGYSESPGKTLLTTMFEQAKSPISADLLNIDLQIKGDPFWLEPAPIGRNESLQSNFDRILAKANIEGQPRGGANEQEGSAEGEVTSTDTSLAQTYILFRSFTPINYDNDTGLTGGFTDNNVLNGVYAVRRVEHTFSGGMFTQSLQAIRDPQISLKGVNLGVGVADTRSLLEQFNIENIIDNPATIVDPVTQQQFDDWWTKDGGSNNNTGGTPA